jgi:outer membrane receptor protein involved in Fe transport
MRMRNALMLTTGLVAASITSVLAADPGSSATAPGLPLQQQSPDAPRVRLGTGTDDSTGPELTLPDVDVVSQRLDRARSQLQPNLGATSYNFSRGSIETLPQGDNGPLNATLLQAPGAAQDSFGQIHVRGDHNEVQFRLDGVQLPEGLAVFGQTLETRFAHSLSLITGSLPAQYGFNTAAVVDITTKSGRTDPGGEISIYGGARDYFQPSITYGGSVGAIDYFYTGDFLHNRVGIENPTSNFNAIHDLSNQTHGLFHVSGLIDDTTRVSLLAGYSNEFFQLPNNPGQSPSLGLSANGVSDFTSANLTQHQREITDFGILSLQKQWGAVDVQTSVFTRYSSLYYTPDPIGDLLFNGVSQTAARSLISTGEQTDASWRVNDQHTIRAGFQVLGERTTSKSNSLVVSALGGSGGTMDGGGINSSVGPTGGTTPTSDSPFNIHDGNGKTGTLFGVYVQDEYRITPKLTVNYGLRFDQVNEYTNESQVSPRINAVWKPFDGTTVHGGYSRYFTPPPFELVSGNSVNLFSGTSAAPAVTQDSTVKAERDNYFDVGVDQIVLPGLRVGVDAYYKAARNLIDEGQFGAPIILTAFNYRKGQVDGLEFSTSYDKGPLSVYANLAYSRAIGKDIDTAQFNFSASDLQYISGRWIHLDHDQRYTGSAGAAYTVFDGTNHPARLSADFIYGSGLRADYQTSFQDVPNGKALPGYYTFNLSAVQTIKTGYIGQTQLRLDVINVLDQKYEIRNGTGVGVGAPQFGLRRTILAGIAQKF